MPLHPQAKQVVEMMAAMGVELGGDPVALRDLMSSFPRPEPEPVARVEDRTVPGPGGEIPVRIYSSAPASAALPVLVWYHGGGWVIGNLDSADPACRMLANTSGCVIVSVDYRLAPEAKYPAAAEDCYAATSWVAANAASIGADPSRIAVGGDSAGGNLAAVVSQMAKDLGGPRISYQLLVYPVTDHNFGTSSYTDNADGYLLTRASMEWFWGHYLNHDGEGAHPKASPLRASDLSGLPPALVITAEFDPLRDEGEAYARALRKAGVAVEQKRYEGQIHGFFANAMIDDGKAAVLQAAQALRMALKID